MSRFARLPDKERGELIEEAADRLNVIPVIIEKDYWVCWLLEQIFADAKLAQHIVFKGGTSLSKVFGAIQRFSEDIDLSVSPGFLGFMESALDHASSKNKRMKLFDQLQTACSQAVAGQLRPELEKAIRAALGAPRGGGAWLTYQQDKRTNSPVLNFEYPSVLPPGRGYIQPAVKLEFGSLTDQRPTGPHTVKSMLAEAIPALEAEAQGVVAMAIERTFWEKATILHAEYHRPAAQPLRDRFARHYSDMAALWRHPTKTSALKRLDLLNQVAAFKSRFFSSAWSSYETAKPGTLKLCPLPKREAELARDYVEMSSMFLAPPPQFSEILEALREAEREINRR